MIHKNEVCAEGRHSFVFGLHQSFWWFLMCRALCLGVFGSLYTLYWKICDDLSSMHNITFKKIEN